MSYVTIYYRLDNGAWRVWKTTSVSSSSDTFDSGVLDLSNGTVYWFKCIGVDSTGNVEAEGESNVCNITYVYWAMPTASDYGSIPEMVKNTLTNMYFWVVIVFLIIILSALVWRKKNIQKKIIQVEKRHRRPMYIEETF